MTDMHLEDEEEEKKAAAFYGWPVEDFAARFSRDTKDPRWPKGVHYVAGSKYLIRSLYDWTPFRRRYSSFLSMMGGGPWSKEEARLLHPILASKWHKRLANRSDNYLKSDEVDEMLKELKFGVGAWALPPEGWHAAAPKTKLQRLYFDGGFDVAAPDYLWYPGDDRYYDDPNVDSLMLWLLKVHKPNAAKDSTLIYRVTDQAHKILEVLEIRRMIRDSDADFDHLLKEKEIYVEDAPALRTMTGNYYELLPGHWLELFYPEEAIDVETLLMDES